MSLEGKYGLNNSLARGRVKCIFSIKQRATDKPTGDSCVPFMTEIAIFFKCKIIYKSANEITFLAQADSKHHLISYYFDKYPLMTSKYLDYISFVKAFNYLGKRLTDQEIVEVQEIKNSMNTNRKHFEWNHLSNFYK